MLLLTFVGTIVEFRSISMGRDSSYSSTVLCDEMPELDLMICTLRGSPAVERAMT